MTDDPDKLAASAKRDASRAQFRAWMWWVQIPLVAIVYWLVSKEPWPEKLMLVYLAVVSIIAIAVTYEAKSEAAKAKAAGYENP